RAQELVCLATANLPEFLTVNVLSPQNAKNLFLSIFSRLGAVRAGLSSTFATRYGEGVKH
ncbi:hypothetical protein ACW5XI_11365, partial [Aeromonas australiensis]